MDQGPHFPVDLAVVLVINIVFAVLIYCGLLLWGRASGSRLTFESRRGLAGPLCSQDLTMRLGGAADHAFERSA